uniref:Shell protein 5 n=1 Tax=Patelloida mimula TaxID=351188 RepID=A0A8U0AWF4_9GAST|nr:shell protein 5 [Patelloida mimula]
MLPLLVLGLALVAGAVPVKEQTPLPIADALQTCRDLGVDIQAYGTKDEFKATRKESKNLRRCFDILTSAEQTAVTEVAMLGVLMKRLQVRQELGEPIFELLAKGLPDVASKGITAKSITRGAKSAVLSRKKRQMYGGGEIGEDPGKRARKLRLGLPLGEPGEDPGKRMRQRQTAQQQNPAYQAWLRKYYRWYQYWAAKRRNGAAGGKGAQG